MGMCMTEAGVGSPVAGITGSSEWLSMEEHYTLLVTEPTIKPLSEHVCASKSMYFINNVFHKLHKKCYSSDAFSQGPSPGGRQAVVLQTLGAGDLVGALRSLTHAFAKDCGVPISSAPLPGLFFVS